MDNQWPVTRRALGADWEKLHETVRRHYDLAPGADHSLTLTGRMEQIEHSLWAKPFILVGRVFGALVPYRGRDVAVEVCNHTRPHSPAMFWHRTFRFHNRPPCVFQSRMEHLAGNEIVEFVRFNLGICMHLSAEDGALCYTSNGYLWRLGPFNLRIPDWLLFGTARIIEYGADGDTIMIDFTIRHPLWGDTFGYTGSFQLSGTADCK